MADPSDPKPTGKPQRRKPEDLTPAEVARILGTSKNLDDAKLRLHLGPVTDKALVDFVASKGLLSSQPKDTIQQRITDAAGGRSPWAASQGPEIGPGRPDHEKILDGHVWQATPEGFVKTPVQGTAAQIERMQEAADLGGARQMRDGLLLAAAGMQKGSASRPPPTAERPRTESVQRAFKPPAQEPPQRTVKDGNVGPKVEGPKPTVTEGKTPTKAEPRTEARTEPKPEAKVGPRTEPKPEAKGAPRTEPKPEPKADAKTEPKAEANAGPKPKPEANAKPEAGAKPKTEAKTGGSNAGPPTASQGERPIRLPRSGTKSLDRHLERAFAGRMEGSAGKPTEARRTVDSIVAKIEKRAAVAALKDSTFQALEKAGDRTGAGTRFHTLAKLEANKMVTNGEVPKGYQLSAELTVQGKDGHSRLDILVKAPDGSLHERDWKTTVKSGLDSKAAKPQTGEMARHQAHVEYERKQPLASQESRSWVPAVQQAKNREAKQTADGITKTIVERAGRTAEKDGTYKGHLEAGNVAEADKTFNTIAKQETDKMVKSGELPKGCQVQAELTKGRDGQSQLQVRVRMPEGYPERDWSATVKSVPGEVAKPATGERAGGGEGAGTGRTYSWSSAPTVRPSPAKDGEKPAAAGPKVDGAYAPTKPKAEAATPKPAGDKVDKPNAEKAAKPQADKPVQVPKPEAPKPAQPPPARMGRRP